MLIKDDAISENEWLSFAMKGGAYDFLNDPGANIYTLEDGKKSLYNPEFVKKILQGGKDLKEAKDRKITIDELNELWK